MPAIELRIRDFGEQLNGLLTLPQLEIQQYVEAGIERALNRLGEDIINEVVRLAAQKVYRALCNLTDPFRGLNRQLSAEVLCPWDGQAGV